MRKQGVGKCLKVSYNMSHIDIMKISILYVFYYKIKSSAHTTNNALLEITVKKEKIRFIEG
jgi:hypothetical protein